MNEQTLTLPITGMSCANCSANITRTVSKLDGVSNANVNFAADQAVISFDPAKISLHEIINKIQDLGFKVPSDRKEIPVTGMSCANCAANIERTLNKKTVGIVQASVNFATEKLLIDYIPSIVSMDDIVAGIKKIGFDLIMVDDNLNLKDGEKDVDEIARNAEIKDQTQKFMIGVVFALPLFLMSMSRDFGLIGSWSHAPWVNWFFLFLATPVQFYTGIDYYIGAYKNLKNRSTNMDVLIALGSSVAYFYSISILLFSGIGDHVYF